MKRFLCQIYNRIMRLRNIIKWRKQRPIGCMEINDAKSIKDAITDDKKILIIVPHPDDDLIGCDSIIKKYREQIVVFYSGMLGNDYSEKNRLIRTAEFENYCKQLNVNYFVNNGDIKTALNRLIKETHFGYIFMPSIVDWHEEHRELFKTTVELVKNEEIDAKLFCYQITVPIPQNYITHYSKMTKGEQKEKWKRFRETYISQRFMPVERFKTVERSYSKNDQTIIAEVFMEPKGNYDKADYVCGINIKEINNLEKILKSANDEYESTWGK